MGVNFFPGKMTKPGGGPRGVWQKTILFPKFFLDPSLKLFSGPPYNCFSKNEDAVKKNPKTVFFSERLGTDVFGAA